MAKKKSNKKTSQFTSKKASGAKKSVETLRHQDAQRKNIPTAEFESIMDKQAQKPVPVAYERPGADAAVAQASEIRERNPDLDPQLIWRGKFPDGEAPTSGGDLVVQAPPLFIQEKVHPKVLIDDLRKQTEAAEIARKLANPDKDNQPLTSGEQPDLFADFNGLAAELDDEARTDFYHHDQNWTNRMILGDSLAVMASLAEREGLRGKVQCIYLDPPYGIKFNSNFQWSTTSRDVKDGKADHITREPEQVKAFRDTWRDGIHSYLTYLRDRLTAARDLLHDTGSIFVQIGDENVHRVRAVMDEVFGEDNFVAFIKFKTSSGFETQHLSELYDYTLWYGRSKAKLKYRQLFCDKPAGEGSYYQSAMLARGEIVPVSDERVNEDARFLINQPLVSSGESPNLSGQVQVMGRTFRCGSNRHWKTSSDGIKRLSLADRIHASANTIKYRRFHSDYPVSAVDTLWSDTVNLIAKNYVVETNPKVIERCLLMATDPGDLVLDPTCGSGTTAYVAEQWGRRWITIDTSRVSLALARARIMGARYPFYLLADSPEGAEKEAELTRTDLPDDFRSRHYAGDIRQGFVYERVPHITLKSIANNAEIDVIYERFQQRLEPLREQLNEALGTSWEAWEIPRELDDVCRDRQGARQLHAQWWEQRIQRQKEIDASIAAKADHEYLYDKPYEDKKTVRVAGPFTVESLSPHRVLGVDENDELIDPLDDSKKSPENRTGQDFTDMVLENLKTAGVQQAHKEDKITFTSIRPWPGKYIAAEARYVEGPRKGDPDKGREKRAGVFIGPEFGTVRRQDLVEAAKEAGDADFDVVIACAFNYEAHASEFDSLGRIRVLKARMNADLHMAEDLKNTGKGNLFVIFGEPDIDLLPPEDAPQPDRDKDEKADLSGYDTLRVRINGVDVFHPATGEIESSNADGIACWFIDTDYNGESFFVKHAYFLGANDPYKSLKTTLKAEIDQEAWESLHSDISREFPKPEGGRIAVKVINHLGDEVMKVFRVE